MMKLCKICNKNQTLLSKCFDCSFVLKETSSPLLRRKKVVKIFPPHSEFKKRNIDKKFQGKDRTRELVRQRE